MTTPSIGSRLSLVAVILASIVVAGCGGDSSQAPGLVAPAGLTYSVNPAAYTVGAAITTNIPSSTGGTIGSYSVAPSLPLGLVVNPITGVISGSPTTITPAAGYAVTGFNCLLYTSDAADE